MTDPSDNPSAKPSPHRGIRAAWRAAKISCLIFPVLVSIGSLMILIEHQVRTKTHADWLHMVFESLLFTLLFGFIFALVSATIAILAK